MPELGHGPALLSIGAKRRLWVGLTRSTHDRRTAGSVRTGAIRQRGTRWLPCPLAIAVSSVAKPRDHELSPPQRARFFPGAGGGWRTDICSAGVPTGRSAQGNAWDSVARGVTGRDEEHLWTPKNEIIRIISAHDE